MSSLDRQARSSLPRPGSLIMGVVESNQTTRLIKLSCQHNDQALEVLGHFRPTPLAPSHTGKLTQTKQKARARIVKAREKKHWAPLTQQNLQIQGNGSGFETRLTKDG